jgi:uncharacterized protein (TIGR02996 family)
MMTRAGLPETTGIVAHAIVADSRGAFCWADVQVKKMTPAEPAKTDHPAGRIMARSHGPEGEAMSAHWQRIRYEGKERLLLSLPLNDYADPEHALPAFVSTGSADWPGHVATWAIEGRTLLLSDVYGWVTGARRVVRWAEVFPHRPPPLPASWFTGELRITMDERIDYANHVIRRSERILALDRGQVILSDLYAFEDVTGGDRRSRHSALVCSELVGRPEGHFTDEEWAFIVALRAGGADPANWLVYADWLTDRGEAGRGDYLRLRAPGASAPDTGRLAALERDHLLGSAWWLRLLGLVPAGDELLSDAPFHQWREAYFLRRA